VTSELSAVENTIILEVAAYRHGHFWSARGVEVAVFTQGRTLDELWRNLTEATTLHFGGEPGRKAGHTLRLRVTIEIACGKGDAGARDHAPRRLLT